jgi:hypothetical protein
MTSRNDSEYTDIPLSIDDILSICKEYQQLGWQIQNQVEQIMDLGVEEAINTKIVQLESLPHIRSFLEKIKDNPYFGEAGGQSQECIFKIKSFQSIQNNKSN